MEPVAPEDHGTGQRLPVRELHDRARLHPDGHRRAGEADVTARGAQGVDQVGHQQLLRVDVMIGPAQRAVVVHKASAPAAELAGAERLAPSVQAVGHAVPVQQPHGPLLDQPGPGPGPHRVLVKALQHHDVDARTDQHVRCQQPRGTRPDDHHRGLHPRVASHAATHRQAVRRRRGAATWPSDHRTRPAGTCTIPSSGPSPTT